MKKFLSVALPFLVASIASALAQTYPSRPITVIVGFPPGVATDAVGRTIAEHMKTSLGQPIVFENATGAGGTIATARATRAAPDGYTLSLGNLGSHVVSPATYPNIQYHPLNDFEPVALLGTSAYWLVAKKALPPNDLKALIAWLKANPDKASAAMVGTGGIDQIAGTPLAHIAHARETSPLRAKRRHTEGCHRALQQPIGLSPITLNRAPG